jgi:O-antigen/teichoic acid export membrane protein
VSLGNRAAILTLSRLANYGLLLISPLILVRLLTVEQFGRYREFLLYAAVLQSLAAFSINDSVLYCIPAHPHSRWRTVRQTAVLIACTSLLTVAALAAIDRASGGRAVGTLLLPLCAFTLASANLDFWDFFWVATNRPGLVFAYSSVRLGARVIVATVAAALMHDVRAIIWALVGLEALRLIAAAAVMAAADRAATEPKLPEPWREQLRYCVPSGTASILSMLNRNLSSLAVAKVLGAVALAQYTIGQYAQPAIVTLRNSVSAVVLPEMVRRERDASGERLELWQRATVVNTIVLLPVVALVLRYASPLVGTVFGAAYLPAAVLLRIFMLVVVRACVDFAPALRAVNRTRPLVESSIASIAACALLLYLLVPTYGAAGAMAAFALCTLVDSAWLARATLRHYGVSLGELLPWSSLGKVAAAALIAAAVLATSFWRQALGTPGMAVAAASYLGAFSLLLLALKVPEAHWLLAWARRCVPALSAACRRA